MFGFSVVSILKRLIKNNYETESKMKNLSYTLRKIYIYIFLSGKTESGMWTLFIIHYFEMARMVYNAHIS